MKSGTYQVTFNVDIVNCEDESEAVESLKGMFSEALDSDFFPEVNFEFVEGTETDYTVEEETLSEVNFG